VALDDSASLRALAAQCRSLSRGASTGEVAASLMAMAQEYERKAVLLAAREAEMPVAAGPRAG
jgi:hypothetical protein